MGKRIRVVIIFFSLALLLPTTSNASIIDGETKEGILEKKPTPPKLGPDEFVIGLGGGGIGTEGSVLATATRGDGSIFHITRITGTWKEMQTYAQSIRGDLMRIKDAIDNQIARELVNTANLGNAWIGYRSPWSHWVDGFTPTYLNWDPGEPSNSGGVENVAEINYFGRWNDVRDNFQRVALIQLRPQPPPKVPESTTCALALAALCLAMHHRRR